MKSHIVRSRLSEPQMKYLEMITRELRADPGDVLLALAFGTIEADAEGGCESCVAQYIALLRSFVDERKLPSADPGDFNNYHGGGRVVVELPKAKA